MITFKIMYRFIALRISKYFKRNPKSLFYLDLILHVLRFSELVPGTIFDMSEINELYVRIEFC